MSSPWRPFRLLPDDVLFFRDGKPSGLGADHAHRSLFPPYPATLYGALRTRRLLDEGVSLSGLDRRWAELPAALRRELGEWGGFGELELRGPWLLRGDEVLLPAPADLGLDLEGGGGGGESLRADRVVRLRRAAVDGGHSHGLALLEPPGDAAERRRARPREGWFLTPKGMSAWCRGEAPEPDQLVHRDELWVEEARTGVGLEEERRRHRETLLYTFGFVRLRQGVALGFEVRGSALAPGCRVRLGGEGRTAWLEDGPPFPHLPLPPGGRPLRLAFATPTLSAHGGYPPGRGEDGTTVTAGGHSFRLEAAAVGGFVLTGGWDLARRRAKPLRRALPAGSVFVLTPEDGASAADLHSHNLCDFPDDHLARQGFGLAVAGADP